MLRTPKKPNPMNLENTAAPTSSLQTKKNSTPLNPNAQHILIALWQDHFSYNPTKGNSFLTFARQTTIRQHLPHLLASSTTRVSKQTTPNPHRYPAKPNRPTLLHKPSLQKNRTNLRILRIKSAQSPPTKSAKNKAFHKALLKWIASKI